MFFVLSKILFYIAMPITWIALLLAYGVWSKNGAYKKKAIALAFGLFLFFGNIGIVNFFFLHYEPAPILIAELPHYDLGIVLTGVTNHDKEPHDRVYFHKGADRVLHTLQLYRLGKIDRILVTGGSGRVIGEKISEAVDLKNVFLMCGVPDSILIVEPDSRNTRENALFTKKVLDSIGYQGKTLLITSAFHLPRAKGCFDKVGIKTDIYPVDFHGGNTSLTPDTWLIPNGRAYSMWHVLIHEWIGYVVYKVVGYR